MSKINVKEALGLRQSDPVTWTYEALGEKYGATKQAVQQALDKAQEEDYGALIEEAAKESEELFNTEHTREAGEPEKKLEEIAEFEEEGDPEEKNCEDCGGELAVDTKDPDLYKCLDCGTVWRDG